MAARQALLEAQDKFLDDYVRALAGILDAVYSKNQADGAIQELRSKLAMARNQPAVILEKSGPLIWTHRAAIEAGNIERLVNTNYDEEIQKHTNDTSEVDYVKRIIGKLRLTWETFNAAERKVLTGYLQTMLRAFAGHTAGLRQLEKLTAERRAREERTGQHY